jgi:hypothetical protein
MSMRFTYDRHDLGVHSLIFAMNATPHSTPSRQNRQETGQQNFLPQHMT